MGRIKEKGEEKKEKKKEGGKGRKTEENKKEEDGKEEEKKEEPAVEAKGRGEINLAKKKERKSKKRKEREILALREERTAHVRMLEGLGYDRFLAREDLIQCVRKGKGDWGGGWKGRYGWGKRARRRREKERRKGRYGRGK